MGLIEKLLCKLLPHLDIFERLEDGSKVLYMRRWFIIGHDDSEEPFEQRTSRLVIHKMYRSDYGRDPHDHPFGFTTLVLWGGYVDRQYRRFLYPKGRTGPYLEDMRPGSLAYRPAQHLHQVQLKNGKPSWTLVWMEKPSRKDWGFVDSQGNWVSRRDYKKASAK